MKKIIWGFVAWVLVLGAVANAAANCTIEVQAVINGQSRVVVFNHPSFDLIHEVKGGEHPQLRGWPVTKNTCGGQADNGLIKRPEVVAAFAATQNTVLLKKALVQIGKLSGKFDSLANDVKLLQMQLASVEERLAAEVGAVSEIKHLLKKCRYGTQKYRNLRRSLRQHKAKVKKLRNKRRSLRRRTQKSCFVITYKRGYWRATKKGGMVTHTSPTRRGIYGWVKKNHHLCGWNDGGESRRAPRGERNDPRKGPDKKTERVAPKGERNIPVKL